MYSEKFRKILRKTPVQSVFFNKVAGLQTLAQVLSCEFCEISKNTFLLEHLWATASMLFKNLPFYVGY